jgi:hypothetical protein
MEIQTVGAWGELVGGVASLIAALGVIGSLIYLGLQVKQSNQVARSQSIRDMNRDTQQFWLKMADPEVSRIFRRAVNDFDSLSNNHKGVAGSMLGAVFLQAATSFAVRSSSRPSQLERLAASFVACPGLSGWWGGYKGACSADFADQIERLVAEGATPVPEFWYWYELEDSDISET